MLNLTEYRTRPDRISDLLPWAAMVAPDVVLNKDGSFQATIKYRGPDLDSATDAELISLSARVNNVLRRLGTGWCLYSEAKRIFSNNYPDSKFPDPISLLLDEERKCKFVDEKHFESEYYLTLVFLPPTDTKVSLASTFLENVEKEKRNYSLFLEGFRSEIVMFEGLLAAVFPEARIIRGDELLTYLHSTVSEKPHTVALPETPIYLDALLADSPLTSGFLPKLGRKHVAVIGVRGFPGRSQPGLLDRLNRLSIEYRWVTRFIFLDKSEAESEINKFKRKWFAKRKGVLTLLKETMTGTDSVMEDQDSVRKAHDADEAQVELQSDLVSYGYFTAALVLLDEDREKLFDAAAEVERVINGVGFTTKREDVNAVDAFLGTVPGNVRNNVRRPLINTLNLSHLMPVSAVWAGERSDAHFDGPPLFIAETGGSTQFRYVLHVGDVGHTLILGPTGSGKSVLLNLIESQFLRYEGAQVYIFDKGGSARVLTAGIGGDFYDLGAEEKTLSFQPLRNIHEPSEKRFAHEWILDILTQEKVELTPAIKEKVWIALNSLASAPIEERTLFGLTVLLQSDELRQALRPFTVQGPHGEILDSTVDNLHYGFWQCFEMEILMERPQVLMPVLSYLFHRLEQRFNGAPTLLVLDEAWLFLDNPAFAAKIREWLKVLRKANVSVIFATQSLADVDASSIAATIKEACFTKIYLPNAAALSHDATAIYKKFGLNEREIHILSEAVPKRSYYYTSPRGSRLFDLTLQELAFAFIGATSKEAQAKVKELLQRAGPQNFVREYLSTSNIRWAKELYSQLKDEKGAA